MHSKNISSDHLSSAAKQNTALTAEIPVLLRGSKSGPGIYLAHIYSAHQVCSAPLRTKHISLRAINKKQWEDKKTDSSGVKEQEQPCTSVLSVAQPFHMISHWLAKSFVTRPDQTRPG
jgi:hypothetical protein